MTIHPLSFEPERFNPLGHPVMFMYPLRNSPIADWWGHVPFAAFLVSALKPSLIVELGVFRGDSLSAFCQAVDHLELTETKVVGIDAFIGDENTGPQVDDDVAELRAFLARYKFCELRKAYFDDEIASFADNSISLLHIDGSHSEEAVRHDYTSWLPKLAPSGIILFHDIALGGVPSLGVDVVWRDLKTQFPGSWFEFAHSWGLGVLAPNGVPDSLQSFFAATDTPEEAEIQTFFQLMGARNFISMLYRRNHGDALMLEGINHRILCSDPALQANNPQYTMGP